MEAATAPFFAFSNRKEGIVPAVHTSAGISSAIDVSGVDFDAQEGVRWVNALWDTGAMCSCISKRCAVMLGLEIINVTHMATATHIVEAPVYMAHLFLPNFPVFAYLEMLEFQDTSDNCDIIIGMDIITQGDFAISNFGGNTFFSFRIPSIQTIDFEGDLRKKSGIGGES
jgi:hypothetical protein